MDFRTFEYKVWADKRTLNAIEEIEQSRFPEAYSFALQQVNHMVIVEELFKSRLLHLAAPHSATNTEVIPPLESLKDRLNTSGSWYLELAKSCEDKSKEITFSFTDGKQGKMAIHEILFHIVNHGTYHRGNIAHALDLAGVAHPLDGFAAFLHEFESDRRQA